MTKKDCIFCKIARGKLSSYKVYEDEDFFAFLDINPLNKGHILVIPKKHFRWVYDVDKYGAYWDVAKKLATRLITKLGAEYVMFVTWGIEVPHAHIHVIPRYKDDGIEGFPDWENSKKFSKEEMDETVEKLKD